MNTITSKFRKHGKALLILGHIGALIAVIPWGTSFLSTKVLMQDGGFSPVEMFSYRFAVAYLLLLLLTFRKIFANNWKDELNLAVCGICAGSLYFITEKYALLHTTTGNVSLLASVSPIMTTLLVAAIYKTRISFGVALGSVVAFFGVACIIFSHGEGFVIKPLGDCLALSASLSWAIYTIVAKNLIPKYSSLFITRKMFFYGVLSALPLLLSETPVNVIGYHLAELLDFSNPQYILNFLFLVVMCSCMSYLLWNECMKILGPVAANNYMYFQPLVTMVAGYFILGEDITFLGYLGCFLVISGLVAADKMKSGIRFIRRSH